MTLDDETSLELIRLRAENAALRSEIESLECELEEERRLVRQLITDAIRERYEGQLSLF
jgi:hypothetical protein